MIETNAVKVSHNTVKTSRYYERIHKDYRPTYKRYLTEIAVWSNAISNHWHTKDKDKYSLNFVFFICKGNK